MAFDVEVTKNEGSGNKSTVDWAAMNQYIVETCNLQEPETLIGVVAGIVDLGKQEQPDAEYPFVGSAEDESAAVAEKPDTYFKDGIDQTTKKKVRLKCWPVKPVQCVAVAIDFPDILLDKGQFFGEMNSEAKPLRMWLGDSFWMDGIGSVVARPTPLKITNLEKDRSKPVKWSLSQLHLFYKMAVASKLIQPGDVFLPDRIDELIGKAFQFQVQIYMREGKDGKQYMTEKIKFVGGLGRGQSTPANPNETFMVQFNRINSEAALKNLRVHVINTIKRAENYNGSAIQHQLGEAAQAKQEPKQESKPEPVRTPAAVAKTTKPAAKPKAAPIDEDDLDAPF